MYQEVLIPTDGSEESRNATEHGIALASGLGAAVHALSVAESPGSMQRDQLRADAEGEAERALEYVVAEADRAGVDVTSTVRSGTVHEEIIAYAKESGVDLIVMGTHGETGLSDVLMGSVAEEVVRHSPVPVVTVRPDA